MKRYLPVNIILMSVLIAGCKTTEIVQVGTPDFSVFEIPGKNELPEPEVLPPEIKYDDEAENDNKNLEGDEALKENLKNITKLPEFQDGKLNAFRYKKGDIYQIQCQTYHSTIIQLEPGENMQEVPYISEPDVWRLSRGVGNIENQDTELLIIKPDYSGLTSTLIIVTDRRIYQMELKSYKDHYMPYVQWSYPRQVQDMQSWTNKYSAKNAVKTPFDFSVDDLQFMSFNYSIKYRKSKKPVWCPTQVYDNGKFTYIVLDKTSLHTEVPAVFIGKRELSNKEYHNNVIVINQLIKKVTLRLGKSKVTICKKKGI